MLQSFWFFISNICSIILKCMYQYCYWSLWVLLLAMLVTCGAICERPDWCRQVRDKDLYNDLDTEVKRQIWTDHQTLFGDEVSPLFIQYVQQKEAALLTHTNLSNFFDLTPKVSGVSGALSAAGTVVHTFTNPKL